MVPHDLFEDAPEDPRKVMVTIPGESVKAVEGRKRSACDIQDCLVSPKTTRADHLGTKENFSHNHNITSTKSIGSGRDFVDLSSDGPGSSPASIATEDVREVRDTQRAVACDPLTFNPRYLCLRFVAGEACMGEFPQNWACRSSPVASRGKVGRECKSEEENDDKCNDSVSQQPYMCIKSPTPLHVSCQDLVATTDNRSLSSSTLTSGCTTQYLGCTADTRFHHENVLRMGYGEPSLFPKMDHFILRVYVPSALKRHPNGNGGSSVRITHWKVYGSTKNKGKEGEEVIIKIQYSLSGDYRYCHRIGRHHKSNGVKLEVNLSDVHATHALQQTCWDPDCRNFKSYPGDPVPYIYYTPRSELDEYIQEYLEKNTDFSALETGAGA